MRKRLFSLASALALLTAFSAATARAQTVMEWMTLSVAASRPLSATSSSTAQSQCEDFGWLDLTLGQQIFMPCAGGDNQTSPALAFEPQPIVAVH
jgi:hypothetical protein